MPDKGERARASMHESMSTPQPFRFDCPSDSPYKDAPRDANSDHQPLPHLASKRLGLHTRWRRDQMLPPPQLPLPFPRIMGSKVIGVQC